MGFVSLGSVPALGGCSFLQREERGHPHGAVEISRIVHQSWDLRSDYSQRESCMYDFRRLVSDPKKEVLKPHINMKMPLQPYLSD
jgi:hypothetical protein